jgi:hypothetical protein
VNKTSLLILCAGLVLGVQGAFARSLCNQDDLTKYTSWCLDPKQDLRPFQKEALADVLKGRYCGKADLVRDGLFRCLGDDANAVKTILGCGADDVMTVSSQLLSEDDARKPADCGAK